MDALAEKAALEKEAGLTDQSERARDDPLRDAEQPPTIHGPEDMDAAAPEADLEKSIAKDALSNDIVNSRPGSLEPDPEKVTATKLTNDFLRPQRASEGIAKESVEVPRASWALSEDSEIDALDIATRSEETRPPPSRGSTHQSVRSLPTLTRKETKLAQRKAQPLQHLGITLGGPMILLFDIVVPCIIYYTWFDKHRAQWERDCREQYGVPGGNPACPLRKPQFDKDILGSAIACFGFGELWILVARVYRLAVRPEECAPLLSRNRWELDATSWVYGVAMILALIPFVIGSSLSLPHLYLYSPTFIMGFLGILMTITTFLPFKIPIGINSHARGSGLRPFIYYAAEDFIAVDGLQDREFRVRYNERYESNRMFRRFFYNLTLWWMLGVCVYIGSVSAVIWTCEFHIAFGLSLGVLFSYIAVWAAITIVWVKIEMKRESRAYEAGETEA